MKEIVHPEKKMISFTHTYIVPNLYDLFSAEHKRRYFEKSLNYINPHNAS